MHLCSKVLQVLLVGQRVNVCPGLGIANFSSIKVLPFAFLLVLCESGCVLTALPTLYIANLMNFYQSNRWNRVLWYSFSLILLLWVKWASFQMFKNHFSPFVNCLFMYFAYFFLGLLVFVFLLIFKSSLHVKDISYFSVIYVANIFFNFVLIQF